MAQQSPHIVIAGAGIGGLHAALQLHALGIPVTLCETASELRELGVGINLLPHSVKHLAGLGLQGELDAIGIRTRELSYHSRDGKLIWQEPRGLEAGYEFPQYSIHRGKLHGLLAQAVRDRLGDDAIRLDHHLDGFEQDDESVTARFTGRRSGETHTLTGDVLIGADGIHSTLRRIFYPDEGAPRYSGLMHWRGITWGRPFRSGASMFMAGDDELKLVAYPIAGSEDGDKVLINWIAERRLGEGLPLPPEEWNRPAQPKDYIPYFADWDFGWLDPADELFRPAEAVYEFPMSDRDPVPEWTRGRVSLLGDAAHPMRPNGSNGASQAILDGVALAAAFAAHASDPDAALAAYEAERRPPTTKLVLDNRKTGPERVMQMVAERCPGTCGDAHSCVPQDDLAEIANAYKQLAGFARDQVNRKAAAQ